MCPVEGKGLGPLGVMDTRARWSRQEHLGGYSSSASCNTLLQEQPLPARSSRNIVPYNTLLQPKHTYIRSVKQHPPTPPSIAPAQPPFPAKPMTKQAVTHTHQPQVQYLHDAASMYSIRSRRQPRPSSWSSYSMHSPYECLLLGLRPRQTTINRRWYWGSPHPGGRGCCAGGGGAVRRLNGLESRDLNPRAKSWSMLPMITARKGPDLVGIRTKTRNPE